MIEGLRIETLRNQERVMANWEGNYEKPLVSIKCITYNHEKFIEDALIGFLIQETSFPFHVIVHDDASTDKTAEIVRAYEKEYPNIITGIYREENLQSQGIPRDIDHFLQGEFIAFCEGDDYWVDKKKLQKQVDIFEKYPNVNLCFHPAFKLDLREVRKLSETTPVICRHSKKEALFIQEDVVRGGGGWIPTASIMVRRESYLLNASFRQRHPSTAAGDYILQVNCSNNGALFISEVMSVYRQYVPGSWSERTSKLDKKIIHQEKVNNFYLGALKEFKDDFRLAEAISYQGFIINLKLSRSLIRRGHFSAFRFFVKSFYFFFLYGRYYLKAL